MRDDINLMRFDAKKISETSGDQGFGIPLFLLPKVISQLVFWHDRHVFGLNLEVFYCSLWYDRQSALCLFLLGDCASIENNFLLVIKDIYGNYLKTFPADVMWRHETSSTWIQTIGAMATLIHVMTCCLDDTKSLSDPIWLIIHEVLSLLSYFHIHFHEWKLLPFDSNFFGSFSH